jgi:glutamate dehydrogenase (NAD(P)+)
MSWRWAEIKDEIGRAVGLPREIGGIPLDEIGATGFGLVAAVDVAREHIGLPLAGARVVVQGFGSANTWLAFSLREARCFVAASDTQGAIADEDGLDLSALFALKADGRSLHDHPRGRKLGADAVIDIPCDIWIPVCKTRLHSCRQCCAAEDPDRRRGRQHPPLGRGRTGPRRPRCLVLPDFIANAGGVICAMVEYRGGTQSAALTYIDEKSRTNTKEVLGEVQRTDVLPRTAAATSLATERLRRAMRTRRWDLKRG